MITIVKSRFAVIFCAFIGILVSIFATIFVIIGFMTFMKISAPYTP